ncbi:family 10 glycosylhydrolase [Gloeocapsopsis crepidinum LEGE 06123]|uniref:Family 10 glycosylhydrolase n=2 Tax=Gloeocapsopsis crepidinum TaxID=693223 RepID=A0ABR9UPL1_9CHRO|nr:family 10 glycosylhydrolase [Gloeocapsopsis crepidinum LEGE 06123]
MSILRSVALESTPQQAKYKLIKIKLCLFPLASYCLSVMMPLVRIQPATAADTSVLGVVKSQENAAQWQGITERLQVAKVAYCVIDLENVRNATDLSDRPVVFLPNVATLSPTQAIALEEWISRGGKVIASGPVGNMSQPGVRQLLRSLLGAYWGFELNQPSQVQPLRINTQNWVRQPGLAGTIRGGVVIPASLTSKPAAIWQSKDTPSAVVTTERSTVLGWQWGTNTAAPVAMDSAWLRAAVSRYVPVSNAQTTTPKNCNGSAIAISPPQPQPPAPKPTAIVPQPKVTPPVNRQEEEIERIAPRGLLAPDSNNRLANVEAIALQQELQNLIGRFESAQLAANAQSGIKANPTIESRAVAQALTDAKAIAKTLPQLVRQGNYVAARNQWLKAQQILWQNYPSDRPLAQPEIRAVWLDRGSIVRAGSQQGLAKIFDQLAAAGINTVFFETVNAGYPIYQSRVAPQQNPLIQGWDPLASAVKLAKARDMELHAWVWVFAAGNQRHNTIVNLPVDYPGPLIAANPEWASYDNRGSMFPPGQGKPFLDPANPEVRSYLLRLFEEIVSRYQVDGLQLDYIRYPFQDPGAERTYGYGKVARQKFQQLTGVDPVQISPRQPNLWQRWTQFRTQQVDSFVTEVSGHLRRKHPQIILSAAVFPLAENERIQKLQQHWEVWASRGDVDMIVPMTYALDTYRFGRLAQPWIASNKLGSTLLLPGIRLLDLPVSTAVDQIQLARDLPVSGYSLFAVENLSDELQTLFQQTQGGNTQAPVPYRQPFQTAAARYNSLQQEWNFLVVNNQLRLSGRSLSLFHLQAADVENALKQLAAEPSFSRLTVARAALTNFQLQFRSWIRPYALENSYQAKVWENRLATIERLLNYGETVVLKREVAPVAHRE